MADVTVPQSFEDKMKARIKDGIGDLITDEELSKMLNRSMEEVFFKRPLIMNPHDRYGSKIEGPSLLEGVVKDLMREKVTAAVNVYIKEHATDVMAAVDKVIQEGAGAAIITAVNQMFSGQMLNLQSNIQNMLSQPR